MRARLPWLLLPFLAACQPNPQYGTPQTSGQTTAPWTTTSSPWTTTTETTETTGPQPTECSPGPPVIAGTSPLTWPGEDFAFDAYGNFATVVDWAGAAWLMDYNGTWTNLAPFDSAEVAGVDFMEDGTLVVADEGNGAIMAIDEAGSSWLIKGSVSSPNSLVVGGDGMIYTTAYNEILRIDPATGVSELLGTFGGDLDGLTFTADGRNLFFNEDAVGDVWRMGFDADGNVTESVLVHDFAWGAELDGMATDVCNNVYVLRTDGVIHRIRYDGVVQENWLVLNGGMYTTALHFGSGIGGWQTDHLYVQDRNGNLVDILVGIEGVPEPHLP